MAEPLPENRRLVDLAEAPLDAELIAELPLIDDEAQVDYHIFRSCMNIWCAAGGVMLGYAKADETVDLSLVIPERSSGKYVFAKYRRILALTGVQGSGQLKVFWDTDSEDSLAGQSDSPLQMASYDLPLSDTPDTEPRIYPGFLACRKLLAIDFGGTSFRNLKDVQFTPFVIDEVMVNDLPVRPEGA